MTASSLAALMQYHYAATWFMVGLIWVIQLVHYPMFARLASHSYEDSHRFHANRITWIVAPVMSVELFLSIALSLHPMAHRGAALTGLLLLLSIWAITALVMIPLHQRLASNGFSSSLHTALLAWNWARTIAWSARGLLCVVWLHQ